MPTIEYEHGLYLHSCPNCGGPNTDYRLEYKAPCPNCLRERDFERVKSEVVSKSYPEVVDIYYKLTRKRKGLRSLKSLVDEVRSYEEFFSRATNGYRPWSAQRTWIARILKNKSFSIVAPTGTGKTMFALITSLYLVKRNEQNKVLLVFPTTVLLDQAYNKLVDLASRSGVNLCSDEELGSGNCYTILAIHSKLKKSKREKYAELVREGKFHVLLLTNKFVHKNYELLLNSKFKLIVMDDVDAVLRSGKAIRVLFRILGVNDEEVDRCIEYVRQLRRMSARANRSEEELLNRELRERRAEIDRIREKITTLVVVSSATGRPRGIYPKLFKVLLGFEVGSKTDTIRNIVDAYVRPKKSVENTLVEIVKKLGSGGLVYVPVDRGIKYADKVVDLLRKNGIRAESMYAGKPLKLLENFARGDIEVLVGVATYYGVIVRGLDLPERVKYAVFVGVPRHKLSSKLEDPRPVDILRVLSILRDVLEGDEKRELEIIVRKLSNRLRQLSSGSLSKLSKELSKRLRGKNFEDSPLLRLLVSALERARNLLSRPDVWDKLRSRGDVALVRKGGRNYILIPDVATYVQASGRTSRLYPGGVTKGLSIVIVDDDRLLNGLKKRMKWSFEDFEIKPLGRIRANKLIEEISSERERVGKIIRGEIEVDKAIELTKTALLVVESPNKARTIANFFGKPSIRVVGDRLQVYDVAVGNYVLTIAASGGHVYDLVREYSGLENEHGVLHRYGGRDLFVPIYTDIKRCNECGYEYKDETNSCPRCGSTNVFRKKDIIDVLRDLASEVDVVFIGTDPDTEGEKIGWDLKVLLEPYAREIKRVEFHEVTRRAILEALKSPRDFNSRLVEAQIVRRVEDRWIGFALSRIVQKYFWLEYCLDLHEKVLRSLKRARKIGKAIDYELVDCCQENRNLSAGRVQTPVLGFVIDKFRDQNDRNKWKYFAVVRADGSEITVEISADLYKEIEERLRKGEEVRAEVRVVETREELVSPPPPFTTDALLEEASLRLGLSTSDTMEIAQNLFELGLITYHRTDSTRVSGNGIAIARSYLEERYGSDAKDRFIPREWGAEGAHEAIRPTRPVDPDRLRQLISEGVIVLARPITGRHYDVYRLIFERFIASQMTPARVLKQVIEVSIGRHEKTVEVITSVVERGFLEVYPEYLEVRGEIRSGTYGVVRAIEVRPPLARFHDVIKWMKAQGIGRPSTYAKIVQTLLDRRYVVVTPKRRALMPTDRGLLVFENLNKYFKEVVSVEVTRKLEDRIRRIENAEEDYQEVLRELYEELKEKVIENKEALKSLEGRLNIYCGGE